MEIENETSKLIAIAITLVGIAFVITMAFGVFGVGKKMANSGQNDLVAQVDQVNTSVYTDLDQQTITGTRLNGIVSQMSGQKCAILIATTPFINAQVGQATVNGNLGTELASTPLIQVEPGKFTVKSSQGTKITQPIFVNYGATLKNSLINSAAADAAPVYGMSGLGFVGGNVTTTVETKGETKGTVETITQPKLFSEPKGAGKEVSKYGTAVAEHQTIDFKDGYFTTKLEFNTVEGRVQQFENKADLTAVGKTMSITDSAKFESYVLKDTAGNYVGLVFAQILK